MKLSFKTNDEDKLKVDYFLGKIKIINLYLEKSKCFFNCFDIETDYHLILDSFKFLSEQSLNP